MNDDKMVSEAECGLNLGEQEFKKMKPKDQMTVLYQNQCKTLELLRGYRLHQGIQYVVMSALFVCAGIILKKIFNI